MRNVLYTYLSLFGFICGMGNPICTFGQKNALDDMNWSAGIRLQYHIGYNNKGLESGSHFTLGIAGGATLRRETIPAYLHLQVGANIYAGGLGTNIINNIVEVDASGTRTERRRKLEIDFVNSALLNVESGGLIPEENRGYYPVQHFNHMTPYTLQPYQNFTLTYGINYIFNSSHRNQNIAFVGVSSPWMSLGMYNDGAVPFYLGDQYDRFWTGGGYIRANPMYRTRRTDYLYNEFTLEYNFHRFTYDVQDGYKLANMLGLPFAQEASFYNLLYNNSLTTIKLNWRHTALGMSWMGKSKVDMQDFIHRTLGYPLHTTYKPSERLLHFSYAPLIR